LNLDSVFVVRVKRSVRDKPVTLANPIRLDTRISQAFKRPAVKPSPEGKVIGKRAQSRLVCL
jgi:hypothetical protein